MVVYYWDVINGLVWFMEYFNDFIVKKVILGVVLFKLDVRIIMLFVLIFYMYWYNFKGSFIEKY